MTNQVLNFENIHSLLRHCRLVQNFEPLLYYAGVINTLESALGTNGFLMKKNRREELHAAHNSRAILTNRLGAYCAFGKVKVGATGESSTHVQYVGSQVRHATYNNV